MSNTANNSKAPLIIIGVVMVAALVGVWVLMNRNQTPTKSVNANRPANTTATPRTVNALGAQPPNFLGGENASVTVEEFADFQCGACASVHPKMKELASAYGSRIKFIFRNYPLQIPAHDKAYDAAVAVEAARLQGKFWDMQNLLFTNQQAWTSSPNYRQIWEEYATRLGMDVERFKNDTAGLSTKERVNRDMERGRALNVSSTPSVFVNGVLIPFEQVTVEGLRAVIDSELAKAPTNNQTATKPAAAPTNTANTEPKK